MLVLLSFSAFLLFGRPPLPCALHLRAIHSRCRVLLTLLDLLVRDCRFSSFAFVLHFFWTCWLATGSPNLHFICFDLAWLGALPRRPDPCLRAFLSTFPGALQTAHNRCVALAKSAGTLPLPHP